MLSTGTVEDVPISDEVLEYCGANFCNSRDLSNLTGNSTEVEKPDLKDEIQLLSGILLGFALLASVIMALFVDPLSR